MTTLESEKEVQLLKDRRYGRQQEQQRRTGDCFNN